MTQTFEKFLEEFVPTYAKKFTQCNKAAWILETIGSSDAADLKAELDTELRILFSDSATYKKLLDWDHSAAIKDPLQKRQLDYLIRAFKQNQIPKELLEKLSQKEAALSMSYAQFRPILDGKKVSENDIRDILKNETNVAKRKQAWEASKKIGEVLAPQILELVKLRNESARSLGYSDYFQMQLHLQEVDGKWLADLLEETSKKSEKAYLKVLEEIEEFQAKRFHVDKSELGPWGWSEPFCQEDPVDSKELDHLLEKVNIVDVCSSFYDRMNIDVRPILKRSDMYEKEGKCQHAFCMHVDRMGDVRVLNNVQSSMKWLETVLHEYGHAIYDQAIDMSLPWLLKEPPHMITTEAMALLAGRQAYREDSLPLLVGNQKQALIKKANESLKRRQLIFSRWVLVMTAFESSLYANPDQDLNGLWWSCVEKYQRIKKPAARENKWDWATKYHIGLAPVYYFSYLLGEMFASSIQEALQKECGSMEISTKEAGAFLSEKLFKPGNRMSWNELVKNVTGHYLTPDAWLAEFT